MCFFFPASFFFAFALDFAAFLVFAIADVTCEVLNAEKTGNYTQKSRPYHAARSLFVLVLQLTLGSVIQRKALFLNVP